MGPAGSEVSVPERGHTYFEGTTVTAALVLASNSLLGVVSQYQDINFGLAGSAKVLRTKNMVWGRWMRNVSGGALLPKRVVKCKIDGTGNEVLGEFDGYAATIGTDYAAGVIDEWLPSTGCPDDDICFVVFRGPSKVTTAAAGDTTIIVGERLIFATDGKVVGQDLNPAAGTATSNQLNSFVGRATNAVNAINTDVLADINIQP